MSSATGASASDKSTAGQIIQPFTSEAAARRGMLKDVGGVWWGAFLVGLVVWGVGV